MTTYSQYGRLLRYVVPHKYLFITSVLAMVVLATTQPAIAALMKPLLDGSFVEKDPTMIIIMPLFLVALFVVRSIATFVSSTTMASTAAYVVYDLRQEMFERLLLLPSQYYDNSSAGVVLSKVTYDVEQLTQAATKVILVLVRDSLTIIGLLGWVIYLSWKLAIIALAMIPVTIILVKLLSQRLRHTSRVLQQYMGEMTHVLEEVIKGNRVVKLFSGQVYEKNRFHNLANKVRQYRVKNTVADEVNVQIIQILAAAGLALTAYLAAKIDFSVGEFMSFFTAIALTLAPLKRLTGINAGLQKGLAAADTIFALLDEKAEKSGGNIVLPEKEIRGHLIFDKVSFAYGDTLVMNDLTLEVQPGETIALVGPSGSGKTTLTSLIPGFYTPTSGNILLDGVSTSELPLHYLREHISLVSQDVVLFNDSVRVNIAYGGFSGASEEAVIEAARTANALSFIEQMPAGLDTLIGDNGIRLSGGQRQRLAIARALLKDAPVLILDEATSALDAESEQLIQDAMEKLRRGRTTIIIAHRFSTIEHADRIVVLDQGNIIQIGSHQQLLAEDGLYKKLYRIQFSS